MFARSFLLLFFLSTQAISCAANDFGNRFARPKRDDNFPKLLQATVETRFSNATGKVTRRLQSQSSENFNLPAGADTCGSALVSQVGNGNGVSISGISLTDSTCDTCGKAKYCPVGYGSYTNLDPNLFDCVSGGPTDYVGLVPVTFCQVKAGAGLICIVVIIPVFVLTACIVMCCYCCKCCPVYQKKHPAAPPQIVVVQAPGVPGEAYPGGGQAVAMTNMAKP